MVRLLPLVLLAGCASRPEAPPTAGPRPELVLDGVNLRVYRKGTPQLRVRASHLVLVRPSGEVTANDAQLDFVVDALTLQAPSLKGNVESLAFDATGGVTFSSSSADPGSHFRATTPSAHFEGKEGARGVANGAQPIAVNGLQSGRAFSLTAQRFRFDVEAQHATFDAVQTRVGAP